MDPFERVSFRYTNGLCSTFDKNYNGAFEVSCSAKLTADEASAAGLCAGNPQCEESMADLMSRVQSTRSGVVIPRPFIVPLPSVLGVLDDRGYCFRYLERIRDQYEDWDEKSTIQVPGGCTIQLLVVFAKPEKIDPTHGKVITYKNLFDGRANGVWGYTEHGIVKVCCGEGVNKKCMYFDVGSESFTGQFGGDDKWFSPEDENYLDEIQPTRQIPFKW